MIDKMKSQFRHLLKEIGFFHPRSQGDYNQNSDNLGVVKAVLVAGLYPNVIKVEAAKAAPARKGGKGKVRAVALPLLWR
jgi:hypothetical protein